MLKKTGTGLVVLLYLITATGFAMNLHFCGKHIESVKINAPAKDCGMNSKCCKNTHIEVKVKDAHQTAHTVFMAPILALPVPVIGFAFSHEPLTINQTPALVSDRGPPLVTVPIFLKNCTFRI